MKGHRRARLPGQLRRQLLGREGLTSLRTGAVDVPVQIGELR